MQKNDYEVSSKIYPSNNKVICTYVGDLVLGWIYMVMH
jgi:hypothetical protein